jgi:bifunctional non-homologous end joining protein LigD
MYAFDLLELSGEDLRPLPLLKRKSRLKDVLAAAKRIRFVEHVEGIVSKKGLALYRRAKTGDRIKVKTTTGKTLVTDRGKRNER